jgi:hypothetical protein
MDIVTRLPDSEDDLAVELGDAASITRGQGGSGSDDKRYTYC